jgi:creatinine amidohydrolase
MQRSVQWEEMFPDELDEALEDCPVVYLTFGLCEPHGLHNALGVDALKPHGVACAAARTHGGIVAPPFFWHIHEMGVEAPWGDKTIGDRNPWLSSLPPWVFYKVVWFQLRAVAARGFKAALLLTGHSPYEEDLRRVAEAFMRHDSLRIWAGADLEAQHDRSGVDGHAGRYETSVMWALHPGLVDISRLATGSDEVVGATMATGLTAAQSSRRYGEQIVQAKVEWLGAKARDLLAAYEPPKRSRQPIPGNPLGALTFDEAEALWHQEVEPMLADFVSWREDTSYGLLPEGSTWGPNAKSSYYS